MCVTHWQYHKKVAYKGHDSRKMPAFFCLQKELTKKSNIMFSTGLSQIELLDVYGNISGIEK